MKTLPNTTNALAGQWLFRIAFNMIFDELRRSLARRERALRIRGWLCGKACDDGPQAKDIPVKHVQRRESWGVSSAGIPGPGSVHRARRASTA